MLGKYLREHPELVYHGLLTVLMRLIFLLFAEDKGVMPAGALWSRNYSVHGLFERLRDDGGDAVLAQDLLPATAEHMESFKKTGLISEEILTRPEVLAGLREAGAAQEFPCLSLMQFHLASARWIGHLPESSWGSVRVQTSIVAGRIVLSETR